jgi:hypothetical protein
MLSSDMGQARHAVLSMMVLGCSALPVSAMIRSPVDSKCQSYGLKGCPELVDGAIAFAEGNKALGRQKLEAARSLNSPEQLKPFAAALRALGENGPEAAASLVTVADILVPPTSTVTATVVVSDPVPTTVAVGAPLGPNAPPALGAIVEGRGSNTDQNVQLTVLALTAPVDPLRLFTKTVTVTAGEINCDISGDPATCTRRQEGPIIVTDVVASAGCADRAFLLSAFADTTGFGNAWVVPASMPGIHGARLVVKGGEWLHVGARPAEKASTAKGACFVTWSGFRPRLVPSVQKE